MGQTSNAAEPIYSSLANDPDLAELVEMFADEMPARMATLLDQLDAEDWQGLRRTAHQLKGSAGSHGYAPISAVAATLEQAVAEDEPEAQIRDSVEALVATCKRIRSGAPA